MALLAGTNYDPAAAVTLGTNSAAFAMTALDTTNLRLTFTAPANGKVLVRMRGVAHGATTFPQVLFGVLSGATVVARVAPVGALKATAVNTAQLTLEALFSVGGLTPGNSYTWDAAIGLETIVNASGIKYGGPDNATTNDAFGGFQFEIWDAPTLLATTLYDPAVAVTESSSLAAMAAFDTTNLRLTFTAPTPGNVLVRQRVVLHGATTFSTILLGVLDGATVRARSSPLGGLLGTALATTLVPQEAEALVTGLTPGNSYTWDAAFGVEVSVASSQPKYGGPNDTTANNAFGGFLYEIWQA